MNLEQIMSNPLLFLKWAAIIVAGIVVLKIIITFLKKKIFSKDYSDISRGTIFFLSIFIELSIFAFFIIILWSVPSELFWKIILVVVGVITITISSFLIILFWWAPNNLFFTLVPEGRGKIIVKIDQFQRALLTWRDHGINIRGDIIKKATQKRFFGGLHFFWYPIEDIFVYNFAWTSRSQDGQIEDHEKRPIDYFLAKEDVYLVVVKDAEDKEGVPITIKIALPIRIVNPYKAIFVVQNWLEAITNRIVPAVRNVFTDKAYLEWIESTHDLGEAITQKIQNFLDTECRDYYGVQIKVVEVVDIDPGEKFRNSTMKRFLGKREAERIAEEISSTVIAMMANNQGISFKEMQVKIKGDENLQKKYEAFCLERFTDKMAADSGSWVKIDASGGDGIKRDLLELFAGLLRMPQGKKRESSSVEKNTEAGLDKKNKDE